MSRYIDEKDVYKLVEPNGVARVHCSQIDELPRADVVEVRHAKCGICSATIKRNKKSETIKDWNRRTNDGKS